MPCAPDGGPLPGPWQEIDAYARLAGVPIGAPTCGGTTGGDHAKAGFHPKKQGRDYGDATHTQAVLKQLFQALEPLAAGPNYVIAELFYNPMGYYYDNGVRHVGNIDDNHWDHLHAAIRDGAHLPGVVVHELAGQAAGGGGGGGGTLGNIVELIGNLLDPTFWKRVGIVALGSALVVLGLYTLEGDVIPKGTLPRLDLPYVK